MSSRQEVVEVNGVPHILIRSRDVVELHDMQHNLVERREATAEEREAHITWERERGGRVKMTLPGAGNRDSVTGQYVTEEYAAAHPDTTVRENGGAVAELRARVKQLEAENAALKAQTTP